MQTRTLWSFVAILAFAPASGALAGDDKDKHTGAKSDSAAVEKLKASLPSTMGFEVDDVRTTDDGVACITYRVSNDNGGTRRSQAVVDGDKVLRSTTGNTRFANAWNDKCAGSGDSTARNDGD